MRLSETGQSRGRRPQRASLATQEEERSRKVSIKKLSLSIGALVLLVGVAVGAISLSHHGVSQASGGMNNCTLIMPANPLSAQGLATPYQLAGPVNTDMQCHESNPTQSAFVQGAVLDPATGKISVYNPLVIDKGTQPAAAPVVPQLPANAVVALWFGFNGMNLRLQGGAGANCVNGLGDSLFGQFSYCNAPQFFKAANRAIRAGQLQVSALGMANDGMPCPTVRDFSVVDQDQSDNVTTTYLILANGQTAQNTAANKATLAGANVQANGSDEGLLARAIDGALGCTPMMAPDLADNGAMVPALPLNELQAAMDQKAPVATIPLGDPMTLVNGNASLGKTNLYRVGVDQAAVGDGQASTKTYCQNMLNIAPARLQKDMQFTMNAASPDAGAANNLFTFLAQRFNASFGADNLNCVGLLNKQSPITTQTDGNGVTISATINLNGANGGNGNGTGNGGGNGGNGDGNGNGGGNGNNAPTPTPTPPSGTGNGGNGTGNGGNGGGNGGGQGNAPTCVVNGQTVQGCMGTTTINGQTCTFVFDAATQQVTITCPQQGG